MYDPEYSSSPTDRTKRPRLEEEVDTDDEHRGEEDRHPKRQAVPDPETKAPHFAGEEKKDSQQKRNKKWSEGDSEDEVQIIVAGQPRESDKNNDTQTDRSKTNKNNNELNLKLQRGDVNISIRSLVGTRDAGVIIGRGGKNVNEIREYSSARVTISDIVPGAYERILTVNGPVEAVAKAYSMVGEKILAEIPSDDRGQRETTLSIRLLVPDSRMGNLIGRSGSIIKSIQEESGARLNASEEALPMSTERTMTIAGSPKAIHIVVARIGDILAEHPERNMANHIPFIPIAANPSLPPMPRPGYPMRGGGMTGHGPGGVGPSNVSGNGGMPPYGMIPGMPGMPMGSPFFYQGANYGAAMGPPTGGSPDYGNMGMNTNQTQQQILIPNTMVGCIIGKGGSKINEIRQISGSHIKIMDPHGDDRERLVTITGTQESNQMALYLLYSRLESEKNRLGLA
ncbi:uncharacterized protein BX664DRAFT_365581 [Halteromyces radiatus]|uniref:uncharacterized protein n=1 Tax=Halteromyces radiatus TaxID=101107 RepID=UPI0022206BEB|nr:uncharacterized protein BX664DRAFT_365581 [Halteromyces radiatus]KAI8089684.1 hypothetical protein BX664DRAFT_365581 [Halteromyces radiatus]